ncbi:MAG: S-methyl thiohydantoin desulfurase domain-containing protein, partial [Anaerolineales bacterium]
TAPAEWRLPKGLELLGPQHFGFNFCYVPIEKKVHPIQENEHG